MFNKKMGSFNPNIRKSTKIIPQNCQNEEKKASGTQMPPQSKFSPNAFSQTQSKQNDFSQTQSKQNDFSQTQRKQNAREEKPREDSPPRKNKKSIFEIPQSDFEKSNTKGSDKR